MAGDVDHPRSERPLRHDAATAEAVKEALFLANLPVIDSVVRHVCRRHHLSAAEADDFGSEVRLHIIERNYEILRKFEGRSSLRTYLAVVVQRLFLDYRNRIWGKWRPSAEARRHGPAAVLLERLVTRDGWTCEQALETLRTNHRIELDDTLQALFLRMTRRAPARQFVPESEADGVADSSAPSDANVLRAEQGFLAKRVRAALDRVRHTLAPAEQVILKMRFEDSVPVADIARAMHLNPKRLYRTIEQLLATLRRGLEAEGLQRDELSALFAHGVLSDVEGAETPTQRSGAAGAERPERVRPSWLRS